MVPVIGNTPLVNVDGIYAKLECVNPCGSIKDRIAAYIIQESERRGSLRPDMHIIEATSGNTGIAFAYYGRERGYPVTIVMPENMTEERKQIIRGMGATLILCSAAGSFAEAAAMRDEIAASDPQRYFNPDQFSNPLNVKCHRETTGREILRQMGEQTIDAFVSGVGTGGTLIGVGEALRGRYSRVEIVAVEPAESPVLSGGRAGLHDIPGIGDGFVPAIAGDGNGGIHPMITSIARVSSDEAKAAARMLGERGWCVGISSGANYVAAQRIAKMGKTVVTVFPDGYQKYQSFGLRATASCTQGQCGQALDTLTGR